MTTSRRDFLRAAALVGATAVAAPAPASADPGSGAAAPGGPGAGQTLIALGFGETVEAAVRAAETSLAHGFDDTSNSYATGWREYVASLPAAPQVADERLYTTSVVTLACSEDKRNPGAFIASPSIPWAFGFDRAVAPQYGSYHLVWPRDLYQIATGLLAAGDRAAAGRALDYLLRVQRPDGHWAQNTKVGGEPFRNSV